MASEDVTRPQGCGKVWGRTPRRRDTPGTSPFCAPRSTGVSHGAEKGPGGPGVASKGEKMADFQGSGTVLATGISAVVALRLWTGLGSVEVFSV